MTSSYHDMFIEKRKTKIHRKLSPGLSNSHQPQMIWSLDIDFFVKSCCSCQSWRYLLSLSVTWDWLDPAMARVINDLFTYSCPEQCKEREWLGTPCHSTTEVITRCISNISGDFWNNFNTELSVRENLVLPGPEVRIGVLVTSRLMW